MTIRHYLIMQMGIFVIFCKKKLKCIFSTISIAEYCVGGDIQELPLKNLQIVPFNIDHAKKTGEFAKLVFKIKINYNF